MIGRHPSAAKHRRSGIHSRRSPGPSPEQRSPRFARQYEQRARFSLKRFRQHTLLAVSLVALLLMIFQPAGGGLSQEQGRPETVVGEGRADSVATVIGEPAPDGGREFDPGTSAEEATGTVRNLFSQAYAMWPKFAIALLVMLFAWALARLLKYVLQKLLRNWSKAEALSAFSGVIILLLALGTALSVIAGDVRALVGSVGLVGLALSWALQAPIESFTGWLLNSFKGYYHVGDRIAVGEVFGDVFKIDILTTTVWESGGPDRPVQGAQPTGALITFPNSEVLRNNIINYTRDFPYVWDEITIGIANESDFALALDVIRQTATELVGQAMSGAAEEYRRILKERKLLFDIALKPQVYVSPADSWTNFTIRYLVQARERRRWASELFLAVTAAIGRPENRERILPATPRLHLDINEDLNERTTVSKGGSA